MDEIDWADGVYSNMLSFDFDSLFSTVDLENFSHFVIDTIWLVTGPRVVQFRGNRARNFKSLARLLPELFSTQSYYDY